MSFTPKDALQLLRGAHERNRLGHAYLISGPHGSGKRALAAEVANTVNGTNAADVFGTNAREVFVAEPESKSRRIVVAQVRALEHALQMRASDGRRKVAIIAEADRLQPQAANAFLKTLEEPPANSLLLLLSSIPQALPDTIVSRCIPIPLSPAKNGTVEPDPGVIDLLRRIDEKRWTVQHAYRLAQQLHRLLVSVREEIRDANDAALKQEEAQYKNATDNSWLDEREDYYKALSESQYVERRGRLIEAFFAWWADLLRAKTGVPQRDIPELTAKIEKIAVRFEPAEILRRIRRLEQMRDHLGRNIQEVLAIEAAFLAVFSS